LSRCDVHESILIIFGTSVTEKVGNQKDFIFPPYLTNASALPAENRKPGNCTFSLKCWMLFCENTWNTLRIAWSQLNDHSLSTWSAVHTVHQTGPRKGA